MTRPAETMSVILRNAIAECGKSLIALERATGIQRMSLSRFMAGKQSLRLDVADKLAAYFGLELKAGRESSQPKGKR